MSLVAASASLESAVTTPRTPPSPAAVSTPTAAAATDDAGVAACDAPSATLTTPAASASAIDSAASDAVADVRSTTAIDVAGLSPGCDAVACIRSAARRGYVAAHYVASVTYLATLTMSYLEPTGAARRAANTMERWGTHCFGW